jgi:transposase-like protein
MQRPPDATRAAAVPADAVSISEAARTIGINKSTLSRQVDSGAIRSYQGKVVISEVIEDRKQNLNLSQSRRKSGKAKPPAGTEKPPPETRAADATPAASDATIPAADATIDATIGSSDATTDDELDDELEAAIASGKLISFSDAQRSKKYLAPRRALKFGVDAQG